LARDLRLIVRERLTLGDSDAEVIEYLKARYGSYVLLDPPFDAGTWFLWVGPGLILVLAAAVFLVYARRGKMLPETASDSLTEDERRQLAELSGETQI
jgi:cytochrome c-type biogenesis protein CcmH